MEKSDKVPKLEVDPELLICPKKGHNNKKFEFVNTKRGIEDRLACPQCLLTDQSDNFQYMVVLEDFFTAKAESESGPKNLKSKMKEFIKDEDGLRKQFQSKINTEKQDVIEKISGLRKSINTALDELEAQVNTKTDEYVNNFTSDIEFIKSFISSEQEVKTPDTISNMEQLTEYLNNEVTKENDLLEKKYERTYDNIKDYLDAIQLLEFSQKRSEELLAQIPHIFTSGLKIDNFDFFKKTSQIPLSPLDYKSITCKRTITTTHKKAVYKVVFLDDESKFVTCSDDHSIIVHDFKTGEPLVTLPGHSDRIWNLIKLRNGNLASCSSDHSIRIWNTDRGICEKTYHGHSGLVCCLVEFPNLVLLSGSQDKSLKVWDLQSTNKSAVRTIKPPGMGKVMCAIVINSNQIACGSESVIQIINFEDGKSAKTLNGHSNLVRDLYLLEDKKQLISGSDDKSIRIWDIEGGKCLKTLTGHTHSANKVFMFNPGIIVSSSDDHSIKFWNYEEGKCVKTLTGHSGWVIYINLMSDGSLISCSADKSIKIWGTN